MTTADSAPAHDDTPRLAALLQRAQERIHSLETEVSQLRHELKWRDQLDAVPAAVMSQNQKAALKVTLKAIQHKTPGTDGLVQIESWNLCKKAGMSKQTFLDHLSYCAELGILRKHTEQVRDPESQQVVATNLFIGTTEITAHPYKYQASQERNHGGKRDLCTNPDCRSNRLQKRVIRRTIVICLDCGEIQSDETSENTVMLNDHLESQFDHPADPSVVESTLENQDVHWKSQFDHPAASSPIEEILENEDASQTQSRNVNLTTYKTNVLERQIDVTALPQQEPATPPVGEAVNNVGQTDTHQMFETTDRDEQPQEQPSLSPTETPSQADILAHAARLLVEIAGPAPAHIEMSPRGPQKYYSIPGAITERETRAHLKGWKTKGAYVRRPDGRTRALCYDADTREDWEALLDAARLLSEAGYLPIVEDSPARNDTHIGGHLWIIYTRLVNAAAAQQHAVQVAPMLQRIKEVWPGPGGNRVRLPGGKYVKPGFAAWCKLHDAHGARIAEDGPGAACVLLDYQTPAELVPDSPEAESITQHSNSESAKPMSRDVEQQAQICSAQNGAPCHEIQPGVDQRWYEKYGRFPWFQFTPTQLAAWYNQRYDITDIIEFDAHGMANASVIGRPERTPSLGYTTDRKRFTDFGASTRRADGKPDGGDVLELRVRVNEAQYGMSKSETMREIARQLIDEAIQALESSVHSGNQPPPWVQAFMSPAGWEQYHHVREELGSTDEAGRAITKPASHTGGVAGFSPAQDTVQTWNRQTDQEPRQPHNSARGVPAETQSTYETAEAFAAEIGAEIGDPCHTCDCTLFYHNSVGESICHQCLLRPQKYAPGMLTDHQWERLRALFPRKG